MPSLDDPKHPFGNMPALRVGARLSEQLADALAVSIRDGQLAAGQKLPTEQALVERFGVSRTVVREALSRLKTLGLIESRQGSGAFVQVAPQQALAQLSLEPDGSVDAVIQMVEVRRALEAEVAELAAERRSKADVLAIKAALQALADAVAAGRDGADEDVSFHRAIAKASGNPFMIHTLDYLARFLHGATRVTRANEARREDFSDAVKQEHLQIVKAIAAGDPAAARAAAAQHMKNALLRIRQADPAFWQQDGTRLARPLVEKLPE